ncbi:MAG: glycosyltransferase family 39 protein, partial [Anaerolineae bacterium]|nr:glycosyltransferase family 39 protein [Anaerolineae bacterium]
MVTQLEHEKNPPGYYILLHFWLTAAGSSALAGRLFSLLFGVLSVALSYRLGLDFAKSVRISSAELVGLGAAVAVGASAYYIYYLHELRVYTLVVACSAFMVWAYLRLIQAEKRHSWALRIGFVVVTAGSLYFHYQLAFVLVVIGLYHLLMVRKDRQWWRVSLLLVAAGLLYFPWIWTLYQFSEASKVNPVVGMSLLKTVTSLALTFSNNSVALLAVLIFFAIYKQARRLRFIIFVVAVGVGVTLAANVYYPFINQIRYIIFLWPLLAVLVGLGVERLCRLGVAPMVILAIWVLAALWTIGNNDFSSYLYGIIPSWREFRTELQEHAEAGDMVAYHAGNYDWIRSLELDHYLYGLPIKHQMTEYIPGKPDNDDYFNHAKSFVDQSQNIWLAVSHVDPPNFRLADFERALKSEQFAECYTALDDESVTLTLYTRLKNPADMPMQFGDGIHIQLAETVDVSASGQVTVVLGSSKADSVPNDQYSVAVHVVDAAGNLVAQSDYGLPNAQNACHQTTLQVPAGAYSLRVAVYNWQTGKRLMGIDSATGEDADRLKAA